MKDASNFNRGKEQITVEHFSTDPHIEKQTLAFLSAINTPDAKPMETMTPGDARKVLEGAQTSVEVDMTGVDIEEKTITEDEMQIKLFIMRPADVKETLPVFMFFHGGGWVLGDFPTHQRLLRDLVVESGMVGVHVEYTRSPEAHFPMSLNECYAATKWVATHAKEINVDGMRMAVVGNSVGGNLTTAVAMMAKDKKGPELKLQVLFWPVTDSNFDTDSYLRFAKDRFLTRNMMMWFWDNYAKESDRSNILASPLKATVDQLKGLPPTLIQTAENDILRDEGEAYARKLNEAGVPVAWVRINGMVHDYGMLNPLSFVPAVRSAIRYAANEIKHALSE